MNSYKIPDDITKRVQSINSNAHNKNLLDELNLRLDVVSNKYKGSKSNDIPEKVTLEKMNYVRPSEQEVKESSVNSLKDYKESNIDKINKEYEEKQIELDNNKNQLIEDNFNSKEKLNTYYKDAMENTEAQALKRGLARSSIIVNQLDAFEKGKLDDYKMLDEQLSCSINAINFELNALNSQKENALNSFNISYAVKLQDKINELNTELDKKESEVLKYNNDIALKEAEFNKKVAELKNELDDSKWKDTKDVIEIYGKYGQNVLNRVKNDEIYNVTREYLKGLNKDEINAILKDESFINRLGNNYSLIVKEFA